MKKILITVFIFLLTVITVKLFTGFVTDDDAEHAKLFRESYHVYSLNIPKQMDFAGEKLPLQMFDVRERMDRELLVNTYWQSQTMLFIKRSARWFPVIEPILKKNNVPDDFKYLSVAESGLTNVVSPSNAVGFWQFIEATGKANGLEINDEVDERYSVERSTEAACTYLKAARDSFGSWTMAAAAFNMGTAGLQKQVDKQKQNNYYDLLLNDETFRYVFRLTAIKEILTHPLDYGFHFRKEDLYEPYHYDTISFDSTVSDFAQFAIEHKTNYKNLKLLNPWLRQNTLANKERKKYTIKILNVE